MQDIKRVHFHHANGVGLAGRLERPFEELVPTQASLALSSVGGQESIHSEAFQYRDLISYKSAHTQVAGSSTRLNGPWTTLVSTAIEGLNVLNVITVDRVVARVSTEHPAEGYHPTVSFIGTQFENLRISGHEIKPVLDLDMCKQGNGTGFPTQTCTEEAGFLDRVNRQRSVFLEEKKRQESLGQKVSDLVSRHAYDYSGSKLKESGHVLCSLVQKIDGDCPGTKTGHVLELPDVGRIFFGELIVYQGAFQLIMLRFELGCPVVGTAGFANASINGHTQP